jgi:predicted dehydrogenase
MKKPKIVLVGAGRFGKNHLRVWKELEVEGHCLLYGVVDSRIDVLEDIAKRLSVNVSLNLNDLLEHDIDGVDVVTPTDTHFGIGQACLNAKKHLFVEKPLTSNYHDAEKLVNLARRNDRTLMVGHIFRYNQALLKIKELIKGGELGQVYYIYGHFMGTKDPRTDVGALYNYAVHHVDSYNFLLDELPNEVNCTFGYYLGRPHFEDVVVLTLKYPSGKLGVFEGGWLAPGKSRDLTVVGSKRSVTSDLLDQKLLVNENHVELKNGQFKAFDNGSNELKVEFKEPLRLELLDFVNCISNDNCPVAGAESALSVIKIMEAGLKSAKLGKSVSVSWN